VADERNIRNQSKSNYIYLYTPEEHCRPHPAQPAQPAKDWWEKATKNEYDFCIHEKGL
jgi:hypothetical protein